MLSNPVVTSAKARSITLSMGVALADASKQVDVHSVLHQADRRLYKAKEAGRNRAVLIHGLPLFKPQLATFRLAALRGSRTALLATL